MAAALSGYGTMAACSTGSICAGWIVSGELPSYAKALSAMRYDDGSVMNDLSGEKDRGLL